MHIFTVLLLDELRTSVRQRKSLTCLLIAVLLFALIAGLLLRIQREVIETLGRSGMRLDPATLEMQARAMVALATQGEAQIRVIIEWLLAQPVLAWSLFMTSLLLLPPLVLLLNYDRISERLLLGSYHLVTFRARRSTLYLACVLAAMLETALIALLLYAIVLGCGILLIEGIDRNALLYSGAHFWLATTFFLLPVVTLSLICSTLVRRPVQGLLLGILVGIALLVLTPLAPWLTPLHGDYLLGLMAPPGSRASLQALAAQGLFALLATLAGLGLFLRRDL